MNNYKISKRLAIILLMAMFGVVGIVACSNESTTPNQSSSEVVAPDNTEVVTPEEPETTFDENSYYKVYVPWAESGDGYHTVSYKDTNKLKQLWLDQIKRKGADDGKVFAIRNRGNNRDMNNFQNPHNGREDYYYFKDNGDIVYKGGDNSNTKGETLIKTFEGAVIVDYRKVTQRAVQSQTREADKIERTGKWTVGAIYRNVLDIHTAKKKFANPNWSTTGYCDGVYDFIAARKHIWLFYDGFTESKITFERQYYSPGFIEVLVLNEDANEGNANCLGVDSYYAYFGFGSGTAEEHGMPGFQMWNMPYMISPSVYLGERPEYVAPLLTHTTTFTDASRWWCFLAMPGHPN